MALDDDTTIRVRRSREGDVESLGWLVERFSPALLAQARYRLGRGLRELYDPEDLVQDAWMIVLPRLGDLRPRDGRLTPVLLRFLSRVLLNQYGTLLKKHLLGKPLRARDLPGDEPGEGVARLDADQAGVVTQAVRRERVSCVLAALEELPERDREVLVLRSIEQVSLPTAARLLGLTDNAVAARHHRALRHLRERVPGSLFADLEDA